MAQPEWRKEVDSQIKIQLRTRHTDIALPDNTGPILVSTNFRRYTLSTLVNQLLQSSKAIPFDFLINGHFLRTSIDAFLKAHGITTETTLSVEYVRALIPPTHAASYEHDACVTSVDVLSDTSPAGSVAWTGSDASSQLLGREKIASVDYNGTLRVWNTSSEVIATAKASVWDESPPLKQVKFLSHNRIVTAGFTGSIRIWNLDSETTVAATENRQQPALTEKLRLYGQKGAITRLAVHGPSARILSSSDNHTIGLWSSSKSSAPPAPDGYPPRPRKTSLISNKKRKLSSSSSADHPPLRGPLSIIKGHTGYVSSVIFNPDDATVAYSTSWDHSLATWDLTTAKCVDTRTTKFPLSSLSVLPSVNLVLTANMPNNAQPYILGIDPRADSASVVALTLHGHNGWVSDIATQPGNPYGCVSASYDGTLRVWDVRSVRTGNLKEEGGRSGASVSVVHREGRKEHFEPGGAVKPFGVVWDERVGIVTGWEDKKVRIYRGEAGGEGFGLQSGKGEA